MEEIQAYQDNKKNNEIYLENKLISEYVGRLLYIYDINSGRIKWSGAINKITGMSSEEFEDVNVSKWVNLIHVEDRIRVLNELDISIKNQTKFFVVYRLKTKKGSYVLIEDEANFIKNDAGDLQLIGSMKNITKRKIAEDVIEAQTQLIDLISHSNSLSVIFDYVCKVIDEIFYKKYICSIVTFDANNLKVSKYFSNSFSQDFCNNFENKSISTGNGAFEEVFNTKQVVMINDLSNSPLYANVIENYNTLNLKSVISYPILDIYGNSYAAFNIYKSTIKPFNSIDLKYLDKFLNLIRITIENNSRNFEKQQLATIVEKANNLIIIFNEDNIVTWINESVTKLSGYKQNEILSKSILDFPNLKLYNPIKISKINKYIDLRETYDEELHNISKNGKSYWVEINGTPIYDENGNYKGYIQIENDITLRKESENKLIESEKLLTSITSNITEGIYRSTPEKGILYCNNSFVRLFGYSGVDEVLNTQTPILYANSQDREIIKLKLDRDNRLINEEVLLKRKNGTTFWGLLNSRFVNEGNGEIYYDGIVKDITEKKESDEKLKSYNFQLENIMSALNVSSYVTMTDLKGDIIFVNDKFCEISGYDREYLIGKDHKIMQSGIHNAEFWEDLWSTISAGKSWRGEIKNKNKNGEFYWVDTVINPLKNESNEVYRYLALRNDISARKEAEEEIIRLNENLEEKVAERTSLLHDALEEVRMLNSTLYETNQNLTNLNDEKTEFMGIAAHDLKNPIQGIMFAAELIKTHIDKVSTQQIIYNMDFIEKTATRMRDIINNFLSANAIETGKLTLKFEYLNINQILEELLNQYIPLAEKKSVVIKYVSVDVYSKIDKSAFIQICDNLISNAIKFTPFERKIEITLEASDDKFLLSIKDEGPGLTYEDRKKLFKKYAKLSAQPTGGENSTGLGLSIVKKLVDMMNGRIECISEQGHGATFFIEMPIKLY